MLTSRLSLVILSITSLILSAYSSLHCNYYSNRICPEDVVVFVCRVSGGVATVWRGSIFNCPDHGNEIILRHSNFENEDNTGTCNDRKVVAYSSEVISNSMYSSQLNVTVTPEMHNGTVECIQDDFNEISVGTCTLILTTGTVSTYLVVDCMHMYCLHTFVYLQKNPQSLLRTFMFLTSVPTS